MNKIYFVSYYMKGVRKYLTFTDISKNMAQKEFSLIQNELVKTHPLLWEIKRNKELNNSIDESEQLTRVKVIWWKELTDEEIQMLEL